MKIVHRYVLSEAAAPFAVGLFAFSLVVLVHRFARLSDLVIARGVPAALVGKLLLSLSPAFLEVALPSALLLAVLLTLGRMAADSETTALRAAGIGMRGALLPVLVLSGGAFIASLLLGWRAVPWGHRAMQSTLARIVALRAGAAAEEHAFREIAPGVLLYPDRVSADGTRMSGVFLARSVEGRESVLVFAREGTFLPADESGRPPALALSAGEIHHDDPSEGRYRRASFRTMELRLPRAAGEAGESGNPRGLSFGDLLRRAREARGTPEGFSALYWFNRRLALSVSCLSFGLLALPIGFAQRARGRSSAFGISVALILFFYVFLAAAGAVERSPVLMATLMWLPNVLGLAAACRALWSSERQAAAFSIPWGARERRS